jgi:16S rRNA (cytidine1402-2'-O)-methyltransferase
LMLAPNRQLSVARELTKIHEEIVNGTAMQLLDHFQDDPKGEIVLLIAGNDSSTESPWENLSPEDHVKELEATYSLSRRDAIKMAAKLRGESKRSIYNLCANLDLQND